jgi:hypothetical protein
LTTAAGTESVAEESGSRAELLETFSLADEIPLLLDDNFTLALLLEDISSISSTDESKDVSTTKSSFPQATSKTTMLNKTCHFV